MTGREVDALEDDIHAAAHAGPAADRGHTAIDLDALDQRHGRIVKRGIHQVRTAGSDDRTVDRDRRARAEQAAILDLAGDRTIVDERRTGQACHKAGRIRTQQWCLFRGDVLFDGHVGGDPETGDHDDVLDSGRRRFFRALIDVFGSAGCTSQGDRRSE